MEELFSDRSLLTLSHPAVFRGIRSPMTGCHFPADHDYCRFQPFLLVDKITDIRKEICV